MASLLVAALDGAWVAGAGWARPPRERARLTWWWVSGGVGAWGAKDLEAVSLGPLRPGRIRG
jgi:hypothetical protein